MGYLTEKREKACFCPVLSASAAFVLGSYQKGISHGLSLCGCRGNNSKLQIVKIELNVAPLMIFLENLQWARITDCRGGESYYMPESPSIQHLCSPVFQGIPSLNS